MSRDDPHFRLRIPEDMRDRLKDEAERNNRSMNAEIIARLQGYDDLANQFFESENAQILHMWKGFAASHKAYADNMVLHLNNLSRFVLDHSGEVPQELVDAAKRHFAFSERYLETLEKPALDKEGESIVQLHIPYE